MKKSNHTEKTQNFAELVSEEFTTKTEYPKNKVIWLFACFGGVIGGVLITLPFLNNYSIGMLIGAIVGSVVGFIPAAFTGLLAAHYQLYRNAKGLLYIVIIGAAVTAILGSIITFNNPDTIPLIAAIGMAVGGVSALLTGLFALPKLKNKGWTITLIHQLFTANSSFVPTRYLY